MCFTYAGHTTPQKQLRSRYVGYSIICSAEVQCFAALEAIEDVLGAGLFGCECSAQLWHLVVKWFCSPFKTFKNRMQIFCPKKKKQFDSNCWFWLGMRIINTESKYHAAKSDTPYMYEQQWLTSSLSVPLYTKHCLTNSTQIIETNPKGSIHLCICKNASNLKIKIGLEPAVIQFPVTVSFSHVSVISLRRCEEYWSEHFKLLFVHYASSAWRPL